jgi:hypothetical protein
MSARLRAAPAAAARAAAALMLYIGGVLPLHVPLPGSDCGLAARP